MVQINKNRPIRYSWQDLRITRFFVQSKMKLIPLICHANSNRSKIKQEWGTQCLKENSTINPFFLAINKF